MLDIKAIREDPERFRTGLARRDLGDAVDRLLADDERRRSLTAQVDQLRAEQNKASKAIGRAEGEEKQRLIDEVARVSASLKELEPELADAEAALASLLAATPNVPHDSAPDGFTDDDAVEVRRHLEPAAFDFEPRDHAELGAMLGMLDTERGARTSGSRFVYLLGDLVFVQFALMRHAMDILAGKGFVPAIPPVMVREEAMYGTGFLPGRRGAALHDDRGRALPRRHGRGAARRVPHGRDRRRGRPADAVRGLLDVLPPRGRHVRQGHGRHVPRAPVRQGRDVRVHDARGRAGTSTSTS